MPEDAIGFPRWSRGGGKSVHWYHADHLTACGKNTPAGAWRSGKRCRKCLNAERDGLLRYTGWADARTGVWRKPNRKAHYMLDGVMLCTRLRARVTSAGLRHREECDRCRHLIPFCLRNK